VAGAFRSRILFAAESVAAAASAVALANIKALRDEGVVRQVKDDTGPYLQQCLRQVFGNHPLVAMIMAPALVAGRLELDELVAKTKCAVDRTAMELGLR